MKSYSIIIVSLFAIMQLQAQDLGHALRYSNYQPYGTARSMALGSSTGALGGDYSATISNPAGLAFYRSSEFVFSPSLDQAATETEFHGELVNSSKMRFVPGSIGFVSASKTGKDKGIIGGSFAIGYSTLMNFNNEATLAAYSPYSSLLDNFTMYANAGEFSPFYEDLAIDANLMGYDESLGYWHDMQLDGYGQRMTRLTRQSGYIGEYSFSGAFNFGHFLYVGASLGLHAVRFNEDLIHTEQDDDDHVMDFNEFTFREYNSTRGWGYTGRLGIILRPLQVLRVGATFHLPTWYRLTDEKLTYMDSYFDPGSSFSNESVSSPIGIYDYQLQTPMRGSLNASVILFRMATFSAGYEVVNYGTARFDAYDEEFIQENIEIGQTLAMVHNARAGAELRLGSLYLRGGAQYLMNPFVEFGDEPFTMVYSGGFGVKSKSFTFDVAYSYGKQQQVYKLYDYLDAGDNLVDEVAMTTSKDHRLMMTLGFRF